MIAALQSGVDAAAVAGAGWVVFLASVAVTLGWLYYVAR